MAVAPLQIVFLGMRGEEQKSDVTKALRSLSDRGAIRVLDITYATKQEDGTFTAIQDVSSMSDQERQRLGTVVGALVGMGYGGVYGGKDGARQGAKMGAQLGAQGELRDVVANFAQEDFGESVQEIRDRIHELADDVPPGATCAIALIEHRWMLELKEQLMRDGVVVLGSGMIRPRSLVMLGAHLARAEQAMTSH